MLGVGYDMDSLDSWIGKVKVLSMSMIKIPPRVWFWVSMKLRCWTNRQDHYIPIRYDGASAEGCGPKVVHWFEKRLGPKMDHLHSIAGTLCFTSALWQFWKGIKASVIFLSAFLYKLYIAALLAKALNLQIETSVWQWIKSIVYLTKPFDAFDQYKMTWKNMEQKMSIWCSEVRMFGS